MSNALRAVCFGLALGACGEALLLARAQLDGLRGRLEEGFRVIVFLKDDLPASKLKVVEEKLAALDLVRGVRYVSREQSLALLEETRPDLTAAVALAGNNPLEAAFELELEAAGVGRAAEIARQAAGLPELEDVLYSAWQARAVLQAEFFSHLLGLVLDAAACLLAAGFLTVLWGASRGREASAKRAAAWWAAGSAAGALALCAAASPARALWPWWGWPSFGAQAALVLAAAAAGWTWSTGARD